MSVNLNSFDQSSPSTVNSFSSSCPLSLVKWSFALRPLARVAATRTVKRTLSPRKTDSGESAVAIARSNGFTLPPTSTVETWMPYPPSLREIDSTPASPLWMPSLKMIIDVISSAGTSLSASSSALVTSVTERKFSSFASTGFSSPIDSSRKSPFPNLNTSTSYLRAVRFRKLSSPPAARRRRTISARVIPSSGNLSSLRAETMSFFSASVRSVSLKCMEAESSTSTRTRSFTVRSRSPTMTGCIRTRSVTATAAIRHATRIFAVRGGTRAHSWP